MDRKRFESLFGTLSENLNHRHPTTSATFEKDPVSVKLTSPREGHHLPMGVKSDVFGGDESHIASDVEFPFIRAVGFSYAFEVLIERFLDVELRLGVGAPFDFEARVCSVVESEVALIGVVFFGNADELPIGRNLHAKPLPSKGCPPFHGEPSQKGFTMTAF